MKKIIAILILIAGVGFGQIQPNTKSFSVTVASGETTANVSIYDNAGNSSKGHEYRPVLLFTPSALTSTTLTIKIKDPVSGTYKALNDNFAAVSYTVAANGCYVLKPSQFAGVGDFQLVFGSAEAANRTITIVVREY